MTDTMRSEIRQMTQCILQEAIMNQPEYESLMSGVLKTELGLEDSGKVQSIINVWLKGVDVKLYPATIVGSKIIGDIILTAIPSDYSDVLGSNAASYTAAKGATIPWLSWLLLQGDNIIIATHKAVYDPNRAQHSRTGHDIMLPSDEGWRVPPEFSGTVDNNFVTRAVASALPELRYQLESKLRSKL